MKIANRAKLAQRVLPLAAALLAPFMLLGPARALTIELDGVAPDRIERQRANAAGRLPLPGTPDLSRFDARRKELGLAPGAPILIRMFKAEMELELWAQRGDEYVLFATYPLCHWSGTLGPKLKEGDRQTPEGFYTVTSRQLHRIGRWPRSLNLGFPNVFDKSLQRNGSYILLHGGCSSTGCFAVTNAVIAEVYTLTSEALRGGQRHVPVHILPFRMTGDNLERHRGSEWFGFWQNLAEASRSFERTRLPPQISVCEGRYVVQDAKLGETRPESEPERQAPRKGRKARPSDRSIGAIIASCPIDTATKPDGVTGTDASLSPGADELAAGTAVPAGDTEHHPQAELR